MSMKRSSTELVERILAEIQLMTSASLQGSSSEQLRRRLERLLGDAGYQGELSERRAVSVLMANLRGFTALVDTHPAQSVVGVFNRFLTTIIDIATRYGGTIDKIMGDAVMVVFGAPAVQAEHVQNALACAVEMQQAMSTFNQQNQSLGLPPMYLGIGVNSGDVVAGLVGSPLHREYTVIGNEVALAARIEAQSLRGQVLIGETTYRLAREHVLVGESSKVTLKGRRAPVTVYELLGTTRPRLMTVPRREIRKSPRVETLMPCYFQQMHKKTASPSLHCGQVVDMGYHGLRMISPVPLESCGEIKMALSMQLLGARTSDIYARVISADSGGEGFRCSMEFMDIDRAGQQAIKQFVDSQLRI